jgi:hypothetical protein
MTDLASTSVRRRRRFRVVIAALVILPLVSCWYWPRRDARFVGKWRWKNDDIPIPTVIELRSNGTAILHEEQRPRRTIYSAWRTSGEHLIIGTSSDPFYASTLNRLTAFVSSATGHELLLGYELVYRLGFIGEDEIRFTREPDGYQMSIVRIPE